MKTCFASGIAALALAASILSGCGSKDSADATLCHIHGTISSQYDGKRIFLVPIAGPKTAEYVDSIEIKDGKFEFLVDTVEVAQIVVDYHYRMGVQPLLVVTEPGHLQVAIGEVSSSSGTPQNDSMQVWKEATEQRNSQLVALYRSGRAEAVDDVQAAYKAFTLRMADNMAGTLLGDFLRGLYPQSASAAGTAVLPDSTTNPLPHEAEPQ